MSVWAVFPACDMVRTLILAYGSWRLVIGPGYFLRHGFIIKGGRISCSSSVRCVIREARIALNRKHPGSLKLVHCLPALFTFSVCLLVIGSFFCWLFLVPLIIYALLLFVDAMFRNKCDLRVGLLSVIASFTQLLGYGTGFLRSII